MLTDHCLSRLVKIDGACSKEISQDEMLCFIVACLYLSLKVENRISISFDQLLYQISKLPSFLELRGNLAPQSTLYSEIASNYKDFEMHLLQHGLNFKIDFVSSAQAIYQIICTYAAISLEMQQERDQAHKQLEPLLQEALFSSYICLLGKLTPFNWAILRAYNKNTSYDAPQILIISQKSTIFDTTRSKQNLSFLFHFIDFRPDAYSAACIAISCLSASWTRAEATDSRNVNSLVDFLNKLTVDFQIESVSQSCHSTQLDSKFAILYIKFQIFLSINGLAKNCGFFTIAKNF